MLEWCWNSTKLINKKRKDIISNTMLHMSKVLCWLIITAFICPWLLMGFLTRCQWTQDHPISSSKENKHQGFLRTDIILDKTTKESLSLELAISMEILKPMKKLLMLSLMDIQYKLHFWLLTLLENNLKTLKDW